MINCLHRGTDESHAPLKLAVETQQTAWYVRTVQLRIKLSPVLQHQLTSMP